MMAGCNAHGMEHLLQLLRPDRHGFSRVCSGPSTRILAMTWHEQNDEGVDPLDAFMDAEVMPEVQDREREEKDRRDAARQKFAQQMVVRPSL